MLDKRKHFIRKVLQLLTICLILLFYQIRLELKQISAKAVFYETEAGQTKEQLEALKQQLGQLEVELGAAAKEATAPVNARYQDGVYSGEGTGFGGNIQVEVAVRDGVIAEINILGADGEDGAYLDMAKGVMDEILSGQTIEVDTISGATFSSGGILEAVKQALAEAE